MDNLQPLIKKRKWETVIRGVIAAAVGVVLVILPNQTAEFMNKIIGYALILVGVISLIHRFTARLPEEGVSIMGVALVLVGVFCALNPNTVKMILNVIFGVLIAVDGTLLLENAILLLRNKFKCGTAALIISILMIVLGCVTSLFNLSSMTVFTGCALIATGVFNIVIAFVFCRKIQELRDALKKSTLGVIVEE